jgi:hypothetical protein
VFEKSIHVLCQQKQLRLIIAVEDPSEFEKMLETRSFLSDIIACLHSMMPAMIANRKQPFVMHGWLFLVLGVWIRSLNLFSLNIVC